MHADLVVTNIKTLYTCNLLPPVRGKSMNEVTVIDNAFIAVKDGNFLDFGKHDYHHLINEKTKLIDAENMIVVPGLIDSHTHLVHGGSREDEFSKKIQGVPYLEILASGGGILNTVAKTRAASFDELLKQARNSLDEMLMYGVTTIEAKSGYGLNLETEIKQLEVAKLLNQRHPVEIISTYLGAHALPQEYENMKADYIDKVIQDLKVIKAKNLAVFVDVFCEQGVFEIAETKKILKAAISLGFIPRIHADEIAPLGGAGLGIEMSAASVDHLIAIRQDDIKRLGHSDTIANLLPATSFYLNKPYAPARELINNLAALSISTDYNPGSSPSENFQFTMQLAGNKLQMTPFEILTASTINPAFSLGIASRLGSIEKGKEADFVLLKAKNLDYLIYHYGINHARHVFKKGIQVVKNRQIINSEAIL